MRIFFHRRFRRVFGFTPAYGRDLFRSAARNVQQKIVDEKLGRLAETYSAYDQEERLLRKQMSIATRGDVRHVREELLHARRMLHLAKSAFWYAHGLAKKAGFSVEEKYAAYLPTGLDRYR